MPFIIAFLTIFPLLIAIALDAKYKKPIIYIGLINLVINAAVWTVSRPSFVSCSSYSHTGCKFADKFENIYTLLSLISIIVIGFIWVLSFVQKSKVQPDLTNTVSTTDSENINIAPSIHDNKARLRKNLQIMSVIVVTIIVVLVVLALVVILYAFSQI